MLGDHNYSSKKAQKGWDDLKLYANTDKKDAQGKKPLKQKLDEHLVRVKDAALDVVKLLPKIEEHLERAANIRALRKPSPKSFNWQNRVVDEVSQWKKEHNLIQNGFFAINMASTGTGKTFANAKIMYALSVDESIRCNFALGLRTLTLQTGDEYREKIFQKRSEGETELAVLVGSAAVQYLHEQKRDAQQQEALSTGSESAADLDDLFEVSGGSISTESILETLFSFKGEPAQRLNSKKRRFLDSPLVVSTIDHLMPATESVKGGHHILPILRLMSADLVIDEVDDFNTQDYPAISRLVHLVGMLGRKVMISSATIPPAIALGLFQAYQAGWAIFASSRGRKASIGVLWVDEFQAKTGLVTHSENFIQLHQGFIKKRLKVLWEQEVKRKAKILALTPVNVATEQSEAYSLYFKELLSAAIELHQAYHLTDEKTGKYFSLGVMRLANIAPCIELAKYLLQCDLPDDIEIRVMAYHAQQVLLLRSAQEAHLDTVLKRNKSSPEHNPIISQHLARSSKPNVIFIVVASPIEETGRDHDFDWAVIEPSSMRSIVQMAGRVLRHRSKPITVPNLIIPEYNLKGFQQSSKIVFTQPGYESNTHTLDNHSLRDLLDIPSLETRVDASPRIQANTDLQAHQRLDDLEHVVLNEVMLLKDYKPNTVQGWLAGAYYLSQLAQKESPFRKSDRPTSIYKLHLGEYDELIFRAEDKEGQGREQDHIHMDTLSTQEQERLWLALDYLTLIEEQMDKLGKGRAATCEFLGECCIPDLDTQQGLIEFRFVQELGFLKN
jgi:CRISPR-associated endonuclease/helicase Cas3